MIEDAASGIALIQELRNEGLHQVREHKPIKDKAARARNETIMMENGCVHVPAAAPWRDVLFAELEMFPNGKHDDVVDSVVQALAFIRARG